MKPFLPLKSNFALSILICFGGSVSAQDNFQDIFDGKSLNDWEGSPDYWRVESGSIIGEIPEGERLEKNHWLIWQGGDVGNFELQLQFRLSGNPRANSGIQFRCQVEGINKVSGYQADLDMGAMWLGRIYDEHGRKLLVERGVRVLIDEKGDRIEQGFANKDQFAVLFRENEWNDYRVIACDEFVSVYVNGTLFSQLIDRQEGERDLSGQLALQLHSGGSMLAQFKNIRLRELQRGDHDFDVVADSLAMDPTPGIIPKAADGRPLNLGFENGTLDDWTVEGEAFVGQPVNKDTISERWPDQISGKEGDYFIAGFENKGDRKTGTLTSVPFVVDHPWGSLLVGGGGRLPCSVEVVLNDESEKVIQSFRGHNREQMERFYFDLSSYEGKEIFIRVEDQIPVPWGHINYDDFRFYSDRPHEVDTSLVAKVRENPILSHLVKNPIETSGNGSETVGTMSVVDGFQVDIIAAEPDLHQPIAFTFDAKGRIWVIEAHSYPSKRDEGEGLDKIVIFEDSDSNGSYETRKVFIEGLNLASGLELGFGGVWVGAAPELLFIPDRDMDDKPDSEPIVLLDGFGYQDTHETLNSFIWGPDGWLYGNQGIFNSALIGKPGVPDDDRLLLTAGVWKYHPTRHEFEIFAYGGSNPWGLDFNEMGQLFMTHCRSRWGRGFSTYIIQGGHFWNQSNKGHADFIANSTLENFDHFPNYLFASARYGHGEGGAGKPGSRAVYGGHSPVGSMIYLGDNWPDAYRDHLFTHNIHGHQMNHQINLREGSGYNTVHGGFDMLYSPESTYLGVELKYGPDGSVIFSDWVDLQKCHNPKAEQWDRGNGRLYRMSWAETYQPVKVDLQNASDAELVHYLLHQNDWYARTARRLLQERQNQGTLSKDTESQLESMGFGHEDPTRRLRALWALFAIGALDDSAADKFLKDDNEYVRAWTIQLLTDEEKVSSRMRNRFIKMAKADTSAVVRLYLASAVQRISQYTAWRVCDALARHEEDKEDIYLPKMIWYGLAELMREDPDRAFRLVDKSRMHVLSDYAIWFSSHLQGKALDRSLKTLGSAKNKEPFIEAVALGLEGQRDLKMPRRWKSVSGKLYDSSNERIAELARVIGSTFGDASIYPEIRDILADTEAALDERMNALDILADAADADSVDLFVSLLDDEDFTTAIIELSPQLDRSDMAELLIGRFDRFNEEEKEAAINALTKRESMAVALLDAIEKKNIAKQYLSAYHAREMSVLNSTDVEERLSRVWGRVKDSPQDVAAKIEKLDTFYSQAPLWAFKVKEGKSHFQALCSACHKPNNNEVVLGPDLTGSGENGARYFLENIIDPNAVVGSDYELTIVETHSGQTVSGMIENENNTAVSIQTLTNSVTLARSDIKEITRMPQSMMPPGLMDTLDETQQVELLKYLTTL